MQAEQAVDILFSRYPNLVNEADRKPLIRMIGQADWFADVTDENDLIGKHSRVLEIIDRSSVFTLNEPNERMMTPHERVWRARHV